MCIRDSLAAGEVGLTDGAVLLDGPSRTLYLTRADRGRFLAVATGQVRLADWTILFDGSFPALFRAGAGRGRFRLFANAAGRVCFADGTILFDGLRRTLCFTGTDRHRLRLPAVTAGRVCFADGTILLDGLRRTFCLAGTDRRGFRLPAHAGPDGKDTGRAGFIELLRRTLFGTDTAKLFSDTDGNISLAAGTVGVSHVLRTMHGTVAGNDAAAVLESSLPGLCSRGRQPHERKAQQHGAQQQGHSPLSRFQFLHSQVPPFQWWRTLPDSAGRPA